MLTNKAVELIANNSKNLFNKCRYKKSNNNYEDTILYNEKIINTEEYSCVEKNATISAGEYDVFEINVMDSSNNLIDSNPVQINVTENEDIIVNFKYKFRRI